MLLEPVLGSGETAWGWAGSRHWLRVPGRLCGWSEALMENSWGPTSQAYQSPITPIALSLRRVLPPIGSLDHIPLPHVLCSQNIPEHLCPWWGCPISDAAPSAPQSRVPTALMAKSTLLSNLSTGPSGTHRLPASLLAAPPASGSTVPAPPLLLQLP